MCKVSIIIPAYNIEDYIYKAIESATKQILDEIEIIVVNDGSTDNTSNLVKEEIKKDSRIKLVDLENGGVSRARNIGISIAQGEYIMFLDGDDWLDYNAASDLYYKAVDDNLDMIIFNYYKVFNNDNIEKENLCIPNSIISGEEALKETLLNNIAPSVWNKFFKRELFNNEVRFKEDIAMGEDLLLSVKLCNSAEKVGIVNKSYYFYLIRENSATNKIDNRVISIKIAINEIKKYLEFKNIFEQYKEEYEFLEFIHLYYYRVIVGKSDDFFHRKFFEEFNTNMTKNKYYKKYINSAKLDIRLRIELYKLNYKLARSIHNILLKFVK